MSVSPSIGLLVRLSVRVEKWKNKWSRCLCVRVGVEVWIGVGCLCPPVCNDIVTPCYMREGEIERENENEREKEREKKRKRRANKEQTEKHM